MRLIQSTSLLVLLASLTAGCATDGNEASGNRGPGGKADGSTEEALFVTARITTLGEFNEIRWPLAVDDSSDVDDRINEALDFEALTGEKLDDVIGAWAGDDDDEPNPGIQAADFEVNGNVRNVLSVSVAVETQGAYLDFSITHLNFNSNTGEQIEITDILDSETLPAIAEELDRRLEREIATMQNRFAAEIDSGEIDATQWDGLHVTVEDLETFSVTEEGITFRWDAGFPHALAALTPDFSTSLTLEELDAAISADGLWADEY